MNDDLVIMVQQLNTVQNRHDRDHSDSTGTSSGDDGEDRDYHGDYA